MAYAFQLLSLLISVGMLALFHWRLARSQKRFTVPRHSTLAALCRRRRVSVIIVAAAALSTDVLWSMATSVPAPRVHDEFVYLLGADMLADGRLARPPHALWEHFESPHVIQQPSYASKYPLGQSAALAVGWVLGGHPIVGVWFSTAIACGAVCWMLSYWLPVRWAFLGGILCALHSGIIGVWGHSYWGGAVAMTGGALVFGSLGRRGRPVLEPQHALLFGIGAAVLCNSRPFEGMIVTIPALALLLRRSLQRDGSKRLHLLLAASAPLACAGGFMLYQNLVITGDPFLLPYTAHERTYAVAPSFVWQEPREAPTYRHATIADLHLNWELSVYDTQQSLSGQAQRFFGVKLPRLMQFFVGPLLIVPFVVGIAALRRAGAELLAVATGMLLIGHWQSTFFNTHYSAPAACLFVFFVVCGLRYIAAWRPHRVRTGMLFCIAVSLLYMLSFAAALYEEHGAASRLDGKRTLEQTAAVIDRTIPSEWLRGCAVLRRTVCSRLASFDGQQVVIVHYKADHNSEFDWVFNRADIDNAKVVWARDMGREKNRRLFEYFKDADFWLLEPDVWPPRLRRITPRRAAVMSEPKVQSLPWQHTASTREVRTADLSHRRGPGAASPPRLPPPSPSVSAINYCAW